MNNQPRFKLKRSCKLLVALSLLFLVETMPITAQDRLANLAGDGGVLLHSPEGEPLLSYNPYRELVPASIVKIPLAQVALHTLGEDFRFETHFFRNEDGDLLIRGLGDPFLVSEELAGIAELLARRGLVQIERLVVDDSAFARNLDLPIEQGADDPYAARNSALAVNFNTVNLAWARDGTLITGEAQTPLTELARELATSLSPGETQRINLGNDPRAGLQQVHQLFLYFFEESGITVNDAGFYHEAVSEEWDQYYVHMSSRTLRDNLDGMLRYSNNFIANQLFLTLGAQATGYPATVEAARSTLTRALSELYGNGFGNDPGLLLMIEGSGLARDQRTSAAGMMRILEAFEPYARLLPEVRGVLRKSGTLTGVYNYAGYIPRPDGLYPFVILTRQAVNNRDEILQFLQESIE